MLAYESLQDCPMCGRPQSSWEGSFCGKCEEAYHLAVLEQDTLRKESLEARCAACQSREDCDGECPVAEALRDFRARTL